MSRCLTQSEFDGLLTGGLTPQEQSKVEVHIAECETCRDELGRRRAQEGRLFDEIQQAHQTENLSIPAAIGVKETVGTSSGIVGAGRIEGFRILSEIHRGGQGVVYKAVQENTKRTVALKILLAGIHASAQQRHRFEREVDLIANLHHPNIVTIYESGKTEDGCHYFAMEYIHGQPLGTYLAAASDLTPDAKLSMFHKICLAVGHAHLNGVIHRDIKPSNIKVDDAGEPHLLDFGLAKAAGPGRLAEGVPVTATGEFMGTPAYASPEQTSGNMGIVDVRTDVYSLGVMLYEMLLGKMPYSVVGRMDQIVSTIHNAEPEHPTVVNPKFDGQLEAIVLKALEKEPGRRYQSATALAEDLQRYLKGELVVAQPVSSMYMLKTSLRRHRKRVMAVGGLMVGLSFAAGFTWSIAHEYMNKMEYRRLIDDANQLVRERKSLATAGEYFDRAIDLNEDNPDAYLGRGLLREIHGLDAPVGEKHRYANLAKEDFERVHSKAGGRWLGELGAQRTKLGDVAAEPGSRIAVLSVAQLLFNQGEPAEKVIELLELAQRIHAQEFDPIPIQVYQSDKDDLKPSDLKFDRPEVARLAQDREAEIRHAINYAPGNLNPIKATRHEGFLITQLLFDSLVKVDSAGRFQPNDSLVEEMPPRNDKRISTLVLNKNARWHDGKPLTAADVVFSWHQLDSDELARIDVLDVVALDAHRVEFHHKEPVADPMWDYDFPLVPKHVFEELTKQCTVSDDDHQDVQECADKNFTEHPIGNGPYRFAERFADDEIGLERWADYPGKPPDIRRIVFRVIKNRDKRIQALANQDIDIVELTPSEFAWDVNGASFDQSTIKISASRWNYDYICWNLNSDLFKDAGVRNAIAMAVDRQAIVSRRYGIDYTLATGIFHPESWMYNDKIRPIEYDPAAAGALLTEAGWLLGDDGIRRKGDRRFEFQLLVPKVSHETRVLMFDVRVQLRNVGIDMRFDLQPFAECKKRWKAHEFDAFLGTVLDPSHPDASRRRWMSNGTKNYASYSDSSVDILYRDARLGSSPMERAKKYRKIQRLIYDAQPYLFLWHRPALFAINERVNINDAQSLGRTGIDPGPRAWWVPRGGR